MGVRRSVELINKGAKALLFRNLTLGLVTAVSLVVLTPEPAKAWNCVQFIHQVSSLKISGDAWQWWNAALGHYNRGKSPAQEAVLVFDHTRSMVHGHVAMVASLINRRMIEIDHANWSIGASALMAAARLHAMFVSRTYRTATTGRRSRFGTMWIIAGEDRIRRWASYTLA